MVEQSYRIQQYAKANQEEYLPSLAYRFFSGQKDFTNVFYGLFNIINPYNYQQTIANLSARVVEAQLPPDSSPSFGQ